jgi:hypothetical protein
MTCPILAPHIAAMTIQPIFCVAALSFCGAAWDFDGILTRFKVDSADTPYDGNAEPPSGELRATPTEKIVRFSTTPSSEICG